jgi:hypothetical protein
VTSRSRKAKQEKIPLVLKSAILMVHISTASLPTELWWLILGETLTNQLVFGVDAFREHPMRTSVGD